MINNEKAKGSRRDQKDTEGPKFVPSMWNKHPKQNGRCWKVVKGQQGFSNSELRSEAEKSSRRSEKGPEGSRRVRAQSRFQILKKRGQRRQESYDTIDNRYRRPVGATPLAPFSEALFSEL